MGKVQLRIPPFFACMINPQNSDWLVLEKEISRETTVGELITDLAAAHSDFRQAVFNPEVGTVGNQVDIVLNQNLLHFPGETETKLKDGDVVILLPVYTGG